MTIVADLLSQKWEDLVTSVLGLDMRKPMFFQVVNVLGGFSPIVAHGAAEDGAEEFGGQTLVKGSCRLATRTTSQKLMRPPGLRSCAQSLSAPVLGPGVDDVGLT